MTEPARTVGVERLFPFVIRSRCLIVGGASLLRSKSRLHFVLITEELSENATSPAQDEEFVLSHSDNVQATGFVEHLKLPHYVDFQAELGLVRRLRDEFAKAEPIKEAAE